MAEGSLEIEFAAAVRRLLAASNDQYVARVGELAEITYLVHEEVTQAQLSILDVLINSVTSGDHGSIVKRRLQMHRDALQTYLGKNLVKVGTRLGSRQHEAYIDPLAEKVVHLVGFQAAAELPSELNEAKLAEQVRWLFEHPGDDSYGLGRQVVEMLLAAREASALTSEELLLLAKGYNWSGENSKAFETAKLALSRTANSDQWLSLARLYIRNAFLQDLPSFLSACDGCIAESVGPGEFWHLLKADRFIEVATGECELEDYQWTVGDPIRHPELLAPAADSLEAALSLNGALQHDPAPQWLGDWNSRFAAVVLQPAFEHLKR